MKTFLIPAVAAATALAAAGAASAQGYGYGGQGGINAREAQLAWRIDRAERRGRLAHREADAFRHDLTHIERMERQFRYTGGISPREYAVLTARLDRLEYRIRAEIRDGRGYGYGYGGDDDYRYGDRYRGW